MPTAWTATFTDLADRGRRAVADGDHAAAVAVFREALALWRGAALGGVGGALRLLIVDGCRPLASQVRYFSEYVEAAPR
ncbi:BTAD domain-containing putative transcriptional regulator [Actinokineospora sp. HUAS TT18]|uniref:BTAD domain-containing putative transcriptional regulator n=1 Tax=Actinokineospora sp. HUAS TT18 TaxID=3447451 RepID=UPI003F527BB3